MLNFFSNGRIILISALAFLLSACSSPSNLEISESFADQRAEMLKKILPVHMNGYNLIGARAVSTQIELTLLYAGSAKVSPKALTNSLANMYCRDTEIVSLLQKGVSYRMVFREARGKTIYSKVIGIEQCAKTSPRAQPKRQVKKALPPKKVIATPEVNKDATQKIKVKTNLE